MNTQPLSFVSLDQEIADLTAKHTAASQVSERAAAAILYKTALRIALARQAWEKHPRYSATPFFRIFRVGFDRKRVAVFQVENRLWSGSFVPNIKYVNSSLEKVLKNMLDVNW